MRIIAGQFRGRVLLPPPDDSTRPITDRVKQSLFDILARKIPEATIYDCFAGTGSIGLECLSRGAARAVFFESHRPALSALKQNIQTLDLQNQSTVIPTDLFRYFQKAPAPAARPSIIFLDPPYRFLHERPEDLKYLATQLHLHHLTSNGIVIFRHDVANNLLLPGFNLTDQRRYGSMALEFLQPAAEKN